MSAKPWLVAGGIVVALVACAGGAYFIAESLVRDGIEDTAGATLSSEISKRLGENADVDVDVTIGSGSVLPGLGSGELKDVDATVTMPYDAVLQRLHDEGLTMIETISGQGDTIALGGSATLAGVEVPVTAHVRLVPEGTDVRTEVISVEAMGKTMSVKDLPASLRKQLEKATVPVPALPAGIDISSITGSADGVKVDLHADSITVDDLRKNL